MSMSCTAILTFGGPAKNCYLLTLSWVQLDSAYYLLIFSHVRFLQLLVIFALNCNNSYHNQGYAHLYSPKSMAEATYIKKTRKSCISTVASSAVRLRRDGVTLNFDLLTPKSNQFISVPRCTSDESLAKIRQQILEISRKHKTTTWITDARTTRKHIASAAGRRRRRLNKREES